MSTTVSASLLILWLPWFLSTTSGDFLDLSAIGVASSPSAKNLAWQKQVQLQESPQPDKRNWYFIFLFLRHCTMDGIYMKISHHSKECFSFKDTSKFSRARGACLHPKRCELSHPLKPHKWLWRALAFSVESWTLSSQPEGSQTCTRSCWLSRSVSAQVACSYGVSHLHSQATLIQQEGSPPSFLVSFSAPQVSICSHVLIHLICASS